MPKISISQGPSNARAELEPDYVEPVDEDEQEPDEEVDPEVEEVESYDEMTAKALKAELRRRRDAGREISTEGVKTKNQLIEVLKADDAAGVESKED